MDIARVIYKTEEGRVLGIAVYTQDSYAVNVWMETTDGTFRCMADSAAPLFEHLSKGGEHHT